MSYVGQTPYKQKETKMIDPKTGAVIVDGVTIMTATHEDITQDPEIIARINGNGQPYYRPIPEVHILTKHINSTALEHIWDNTGLQADTTRINKYIYRPKTAKQLVTLLMTYNFKIWNYDNYDHKNTLFLKFNNDDIKD